MRLRPVVPRYRNIVERSHHVLLQELPILPSETLQRLIHAVLFKVKLSEPFRHRVPRRDASQRYTEGSAPPIGEPCRSRSDVR